jgi:hypothetical protein
MRRARRRNGRRGAAISAYNSRDSGASTPREDGTVHQAAATRHKMPVDREAEPKLPLPLGEEGTGRRNGKRCATAS